MFLQALPLIFVLGGAILYVVLGGADFGAGACRLFAGRGEIGERIRDHAQHSMGPVWEANHVWLIFVLTVTWTSYPRVFGSIASTLGLALFIAGMGIVVRGASYALRSVARNERELRRIDTAFGIVSLLTPFMFGAAAGALAAERVPLGNAAGGLFSSWTGPVSIIVGALSVFFSAYMAAVFLAADAVRHDDPDLVAAMRRRAIFAGGAAGAIAVAGLFVIHHDAHSLYVGLVHGVGLVAIIVSSLFGLGTVALVFFERYEWARYSSAVAVACVIAGWAAARWPVLLPGATVFNSAASHDTLVCVVVAVIGGGILLFPSLGLLFSLTLRGQLSSHDLEGADETAQRRQRPLDLSRFTLVRGGPRLAAVLLVVGVGMLNAANAGWCHIIGATSLFIFVVTGFLYVMAGTVAANRAPSSGPGPG